MPLQINPVTSLNLFRVKGNFQTIGREGFKLTNPSNTDNLYVTSAPTVDDMDEGSAMFSVVGGVYKIHFKIGGVIKSATIT